LFGDTEINGERNTGHDALPCNLLPNNAMNHPPLTRLTVQRRLFAGVLFVIRVVRLTLISFNAALAADAADGGFPKQLRDTGLYAAGSLTDVHSANLAFTPQYPLWSDGADKRRWLYLPPGKFIDASRPDAWQFPTGTKLWKEFSQGRRVETRMIERRADGSWHYATYLWNEDGSDAVLAPAGKIPPLHVAAAPGARYDVPSRDDCRACHEGAAVPVLGASALQLSPDRDPNAAHGTRPNERDVDLRGLVARGLLRNLPQSLLAKPPRIAAASPTERAALGHLHGNCGHCHNHNGAPAPVKLRLAQSVLATDDGRAGSARVLRTLIDAPPRMRLRGQSAELALVTPGSAETSLLALRMRSRQPHIQMPPLGTRLTDDEGLALVERWINHDLLNLKEKLP
jgi:hypothetical protein